MQGRASKKGLQEATRKHPKERPLSVMWERVEGSQSLTPGMPIDDVTRDCSVTCSRELLAPKMPWQPSECGIV